MKTLVVLISLVLLIVPLSAQETATGEPTSESTPEPTTAISTLPATTTVQATPEPVATEPATPEPTAAETSRFGNSNLGADVVITPPEVAAGSGIAFLRVANTAIDAPGLLTLRFATLRDLELVSGLDYGEFTELIPIPAGTHRINELDWNFPSNSTWVVAQVGLNSIRALQLSPISVLRNDLKGMARVRVVNLISGIDSIDVTSEQGVDFGNGLGWIGIQDTEVEPGDYTLQADTVAGEPVIEPTQLTFETDMNYTLFVIGGAEGDPAPEFMVMSAPQDTTRVQFVNDRADAVDVHFRPGNAMIVANLAPGATSDWVEIPTSAVTFIAYAPGTGPGGRELASLPVALLSGHDLTINLNASGQMTEGEVTFTRDAPETTE